MGSEDLGILKLDHLPPENVAEILKRLDLHSLLSACNASRYVRSVCGEKFWRSKFQVDFPKSQKRSNDTWKQAYIRKAKYTPKKRAVERLLRLTVMERKYVKTYRVVKDLEKIIYELTRPDNLAMFKRDLQRGKLRDLKEDLIEPVNTIQHILLGRCQRALTRRENILADKVEEILIGLLMVIALDKKTLFRRYGKTVYLPLYSMFL